MLSARRAYKRPVHPSRRREIVTRHQCDLAGAFPTRDAQARRRSPASRTRRRAAHLSSVSAPVLSAWSSAGRCAAALRTLVICCALHSRCSRRSANPGRPLDEQPAAMANHRRRRRPHARAAWTRCLSRSPPARRSSAHRACAPRGDAQAPGLSSIRRREHTFDNTTTSPPMCRLCDEIPRSACHDTTRRCHPADLLGRPRPVLRPAGGRFTS